MKTVLKLILILGVAAFLIVSMMGVMGKSSEILCTGIELEIDDSLQTGLIDKAELEALLSKQKVNYKGMKTSEINLGHLESSISSSPYVDTAYASFNASGKLILTAIPRKPAMHVMAKNGEEYYLDRNGAIMPIGNLKGNLTIVTGNISRKLASNKLATLGRCIQDSAFWRLQVQQIDVVNEYDVRMYTRISDHEIQLGSLDSIPGKLHRLRVFYQQGLPKTGWNKYESLSVAYEGLVIGTKHEQKKTVWPIAEPKPEPAPEPQAEEAKTDTKVEAKADTKKE